MLDALSHFFACTLVVAAVTVAATVGRCSCHDHCCCPMLVAAAVTVASLRRLEATKEYESRTHYWSKRSSGEQGAATLALARTDVRYMPLPPSFNSRPFTMLTYLSVFGAVGRRATRAFQPAVCCALLHPPRLPCSLPCSLPFTLRLRHVPPL